METAKEMTLRPSKRRTFVLARCFECGTYYQVSTVVESAGRTFEVDCPCGTYLKVDRVTLESAGCEVVKEKVSLNHQKGDGPL